MRGLAKPVGSARGICAALLAAAALAGCAATPGAGPGIPQPAPAAVVQQAVGDGAQPLLDAARRSAGRSVLQRSAQLDAAAARHSQDMARNGRMTHDGSDGTSHVQRIAATGLRGCFTAENVAHGQKSVPEVISGWMGSPPHRANILEPRVRLYGLARSGTYWTMVLAQPC